MTMTKLHSNRLLKLLDLLFHVVHLSIICFFLFALLFESMRLPHLILSLLILTSWCGLGLFFGFGYCLVTDLQWKIKKKLNQELPTEFYVKYIIDKTTGLNTNSSIINGITTVTFFSIFTISALLLLTG